jgi:hypothetical protein
VKRSGARRAGTATAAQRAFPAIWLARGGRGGSGSEAAPSVVAVGVAGFRALPTIGGNCGTRLCRRTAKTGAMTDDELDDWLEAQPPSTDRERPEILFDYLSAVLDLDGSP